MLFTTPIFLFYFLPIALLLHRLAVGNRIGGEYNNRARVTIFALTLVFYGFHEPWWLLPLLFTVGMDLLWSSLLRVERRESRRKLYCAASVVQNLSVLAVFKFWPEVAPSIGASFPSLASALPAGIFRGGHSILPPGISFYSFESMSFVIDVYRRDVIPPKRPQEFLAFIGMFPRFVAGPIVRYRQLQHQLSHYPGMDLEGGLFLFAVGLFLKGCFADSFSVFTSYAFDRGVVLHPLAAWVGAVSYTFQIYFDFSGYSLMAIGLGRCLGFHFPTNFNRPYLALSLRDFWQRWHITLSTWLRDYLYIPLGGNRGPRWKQYRNLFLTMLLGGIWHGAGFTFLVWGAWHGFALCVERAWPEARIVPKPFRWLFTSAVVLIGWVFFRARNLSEASNVLQAMASPWSSTVSFNPEGILTNPLAAGFCVLGIAYAFLLEPHFDMHKVAVRGTYPLRARASAAVAFAVSLLWVLSEWSVPFLYFQF